MELTKQEYEAIDRALVQYTKTGSINEKCPRCGRRLKYIDYGNSYEIRCESEKCISEKFRGI